MITKNLYHLSPIVIRASSGASLILVSNFKDNSTKASILWAISLSLGISGFLFGTFGEHIARKYCYQIVRPLVRLTFLFICSCSMIFDQSQIVSQSLLLSMFAILYQISRIYKSNSILLVLYLSSAIRVVLPLITQQNFLLYLSLFYTITFALYSMIFSRTVSARKLLPTGENSSLFGAITLASIWFLIQQIFTFAILHKSQLDISDAAHLIVLIRIFEISTQVTAFQAFDAPNYVEKLSPQKLETVIRRGVRTQFIITVATLLFFQIAVYSGVLMNYKVPASWVILISTCFVLAPGAIHCTPSLLRLNVPSIFYLKLISINLPILLISTFFAFLGNILWALIVFSFNYNFNYLAIKVKTLKVFQNV